MKIEEIKPIIVDILENRCDYHSILIDGPWGCGKTTMIKNAIEELGKEHCHIYYQSLFGLKDVIELNSCFKKAGILKKIGKAVIPFFNLIPIEGDGIVKALSKCLDVIPESKPRPQSDKIFIFDDFERIDASLSYIALLGFFNQLIINGCTIICISSLRDLNDLAKENPSIENRIKEINQFKEKVFDRIFCINESPETILKSIFDTHNIAGFNSIIKLFNDNIRVAKRTERLYKELAQLPKKHNFNLEKYFTKIQILKACLCVILSTYGKSDDKKEDKESYEYLINLESKKPLDEQIFNNIQTYMKDSKNFLNDEKDKLFHLSINLARYEIHNDIGVLVETYPNAVPEIKDDSILNATDFYLLSDQDKKDYYAQLRQKTIDLQLAIDRRYIDRLIEVWQNYPKSNEDNEFNETVINIISSDYLEGKTSGFDRLNDYLIVNDRPQARKMIENAKNKIESVIIQNTIQNTQANIIECTETNDYSFLYVFVEDIMAFKYTSKKYLIDWFDNYLEKNNYLIPDLSKTISHSMWQYCHSISKYCTSKDSKRAKLISIFKNEYEIHKDSATCKDRIRFLLRYYFQFDIEKEIINK